ncbi:MAG: alkaline phosphatase [Planctomycetes bacterium]|nr:alkaline phosphatase [Planctomycetota bacterium]
MNVRVALLAPLLVLILATGAFAQAPPMKGMELYSWPTTRGWRFSLLPGTNRLKSQVEVTQNPLFGVKPLLAALGKLPRGTSVFWISGEVLEARWGMGGTAFKYPPRAIQLQVRTFCQTQGFDLAGLPGRKSVIFFIGDGMGLSQVTLGRLGAQSLKRTYHLDRFKSIGLASTRSGNERVTDSAAGATALAAGVKTYNKAIGLDMQKRPVETILEVAHRGGYATGLVTTTRITHATPACFVAKVEHRSKEKEIASQLTARASEQGYPQVMIGGGARYFTPAQLAALGEAGFALPKTQAELAAAKGSRVAAFLAKSHLPFAIDKGPVLPKLTAKAVELLRGQGTGFFLMVEGGRIDHACHQHDAATCLHDQLDFDAAVGWALDQAAKDPNLLVVVTADHATGSLGISELVKVEAMLKASASSTAIAGSLRGLEVGGAEWRQALVAKVKAGHGFELSEAEIARVGQRPKDGYWAGTALGHLLSRRYGIEYYDLDHQFDKLGKTYGHDGAIVAVYAFGPGAETFQGTYENTEIPKKIAAALGLPALRGAVGAGK